MCSRFSCALPTLFPLWLCSPFILVPFSGCGRGSTFLLFYTCVVVFTVFPSISNRCFIGCVATEPPGLGFCASFLPLVFMARSAFAIPAPFFLFGRRLALVFRGRSPFLFSSWDPLRGLEILLWIYYLLSLAVRPPGCFPLSS